MIKHLNVPAVIGAVMISSLRASASSYCIYTKSGRIIYGNSPFWRSFEVEPNARLEVLQVIGPAMWEVWQAESEIVLNSGQRLRYVAEQGRSERGYWLSSRCAEWHAERITREGMTYIEVLPASRRREIILRTRVPLTEILRVLPDDEQLHNDKTLSERLSS